MTNQRTPDECRNIDEIRAEIDRLDEAIVALIGRRTGYVDAAACFKTSEQGVRAPDRFEAMLQQRRAWAADHGVDPDAIEKLFRDLVQHFIARELTRWRDVNPSN